jgi:hypothetical protein
MSSARRDVKKKARPRPEGEKIFDSIETKLGHDSVSQTGVRYGFRRGQHFLWGPMHESDRLLDWTCRMPDRHCHCKVRAEHASREAKVRMQLVYSKEVQGDSGETSVEREKISVPIEFLILSKRPLLRNCRRSATGSQAQ